MPHFNGGLFEDATALPLTADQLQLLIEAAEADWRDVEPAIFGTLLVRALDTVERHQLGAHFTPRAYVERLVAADHHRAAAGRVGSRAGRGPAAERRGEARQSAGRGGGLPEAAGGSPNPRPSLRFGQFPLCHPGAPEAAGGGGAAAAERAGPGRRCCWSWRARSCDPSSCYGIEINPWAAAIAELVLWIGYLHWRLRTAGDVRPDLPEPILRNLHKIECRDAVLAWDAVEPLLDADGRPVTRWDGRTTKLHPVTGEQVPDETARVPAYRYVNPRPAEWPEADFVVGNPPFIGTSAMREALGDGYVEAIRRVYPDVPESADYVMYWWDKAAELVRRGAIAALRLDHDQQPAPDLQPPRAGTPSWTQSPPLSLVFAIPDHPWVDSAEGAAVRIAMTVAASGRGGRELLQVVINEQAERMMMSTVELGTQQGRIQADLTVGAKVSGARNLRGKLRN